MHHEDWRYIEFRHMTGKYYQIANLIALQVPQPLADEGMVHVPWLRA
jgi:hypothetical protein